VKDYLLVHLRATHFPKVLPCTDCKTTKYFSCKEELLKHYNRHKKVAKQNINYKYKCKICEMRYPNLKEYTKHCNEIELLKFKCATCFKRFGCHKLFLEHIREEKKAGYCKLCKTNVKSFKAHFDKLHKQKMCGVCKVFESPIYSDLIKHAISCGTDAQLQALGHSCTVCNQHFRNRSALNKHLNSNHTKFWCSKCSRGFYSEEFLKEHTRVFHASKKNGKVHYACILCVPHKNFYSEKFFNGHFQLHHGAGKKGLKFKFKCLGCRRKGSRTNRKDEFIKHISECYNRFNL
jgi:hypothetical protein